MEKQLRTDFKKIIDSSNFSEKEIITKEKCLNKFIQNGFPGKKNEDWKFLDLNQAIKSNPAYGKGNGPINHLNSIKKII